MKNQKETRSSRQAKERVCTRHDNFIKECAVALIAFVAAYALLTFGLGHVFGVI